LCRCVVEANITHANNVDVLDVYHHSPIHYKNTTGVSLLFIVAFSILFQFNTIFILAFLHYVQHVTLSGRTAKMFCSNSNFIAVSN